MQGKFLRLDDASTHVTDDVVMGFLYDMRTLMLMLNSAWFGSCGVQHE